VNPDRLRSATSSEAQALREPTQLTWIAAQAAYDEQREGERQHGHKERTVEKTHHHDELPRELPSR
jgi:hypothetical protein